jgi:sugar O-acyltransferase (sialic acid O-acetyltransferase NeuD family)
MIDLFLIGYSGHAYVIIESIDSSIYRLSGYYELQENKSNPYLIDYLGNESKINLTDEKACFFPAIGSNSIRKKVIELLESKKLSQTNIINTNSNISRTCTIEPSTFISAGVVINSLSKIGKGCIINTNATIEHECQIDDYVHIGPGSVLAGNVKIGNSTFVGANSVVIQGVKIGNNVIIGAGAVVINDIPDNQTWVGNPAKRIK